MEFRFLAASDRFFSVPRYRRPGCVIACPVPEAGAADMKRIEECTKAALKEAEGNGVQGEWGRSAAGDGRSLFEGADVTPFLLKRINELTGGESLAANLCLIKNNAMVASQIAVAYHQSVVSFPGNSLQC